MTTVRCAECGRPLKVQRLGQPRKYHPKCRVVVKRRWVRDRARRERAYARALRDMMQAPAAEREALFQAAQTLLRGEKQDGTDH